MIADMLIVYDLEQAGNTFSAILQIYNVKLYK